MRCAQGTVLGSCDVYSLGNLYFTDCENTGRPKYIGFINRFHPQKQTFLQIHTDSAQKVKGFSNITFTVLGSKRSETTHDKLAGDVSFCSHSELSGATCGVSPAS